MTAWGFARLALECVATGLGWGAATALAARLFAPRELRELKKAISGPRQPPLEAVALSRVREEVVASCGVQRETCDELRGLREEVRALRDEVAGLRGAVDRGTHRR